MPEVNTPRKIEIQRLAETLFREKGYAATSMRSLASALGIEAASIYSHVKSKEDILKAICFRMAEEFFDASRKVFRGNAAPQEKLNGMILAHIRVVLNNHNASAVFFHDWKHLSEPDLSRFKVLRRDYEQQFKEVIKQGVETGEFREIDTNFTVKTLLSALNMTHEWYRADGPWSHEAIGRKLANLLINGILKNP